jgi:hypothetical protein
VPSAISAVALPPAPPPPTIGMSNDPLLEWLRDAVDAGRATIMSPPPTNIGAAASKPSSEPLLDPAREVVVEEGLVPGLDEGRELGREFDRRTLPGTRRPPMFAMRGFVFRLEGRLPDREPCREFALLLLPDGLLLALFSVMDRWWVRFGGGPGDAPRDPPPPLCPTIAFDPLLVLLTAEKESECSSGGWCAC